MTFELAVSTMNKTKEAILVMLEQSHIDSDCIVINQCDIDKHYEFYYKKHKITVVCTKEKGLSNSRNAAIRNSQADIIALADDDLLYYPDYEKIILSAFRNPSVSVAIFNIDDYSRSFPLQDISPSRIKLLGFMSMQIAFRRKEILEKQIFFNTLFGTGSKKYQSGEENIFLEECRRKKLNIRYFASKILKREERKSSWFIGYANADYLICRGAVFYAISPMLAFPMILAFAVIKRKILKPLAFFATIRYMIQGAIEYRKIQLG